MNHSPILYIIAFLSLIPATFAQEDQYAQDNAIVVVRENLLKRVQELEQKNEELIAALTALQGQMAALQKQVDLDRSNAESALEEENIKLRNSLRLVYGNRIENLPNVPMPNRRLLEEVLSDSRLKEQYIEQLEILEPGLEPASNTPFTLIKEWGRTPQAVAQTSGKLSTLKGMSIFMQPETPRETMTAYVRALHAEYAHYDNLNIEFFDHEVAANQFADKGTIDMGFRVMCISKHKKSGQDVILIGRGRSMEEVR